MLENKDCWLKNQCNQCDCNTFCMRLYKLDFLYDQALVTLQQRKHVNLRLDNNGVDRQAFEMLRNIQLDIEAFVSNGNNLFLHSSIAGNGKTAWSLRLLQSYFNSIWHKSSLECKALFINVPRFLLALKDNISKENSYINHIKEHVLSCDLVIWDEIGTKGLTQFEHENILNLINARIDAGKSNIYTSNLNETELHEAVGDRLHSRIVNLSTNIEFFGYDKRGLYQ